MSLKLRASPTKSSGVHEVLVVQWIIMRGAISTHFLGSDLKHTKFRNFKFLLINYIDWIAIYINHFHPEYYDDKQMILIPPLSQILLVGVIMSLETIIHYKLH